MSDFLNEITIREVQENDYEGWLPLWLEYQKFYQVNIPEDVTQETWKRFLEPAEPLRAALAIQSGRPVGMVTTVFHRSTWAQADYCYLEDLYVSPGVRGKNIGKSLIKWVQKLAQEKQCARLYWHTQETNHRAQRLYDWIGEKPGIIEYRMKLQG